MTASGPPARRSMNDAPAERGQTSFYLVSEPSANAGPEMAISRAKGILKRRRWTILKGFLAVFSVAVVLTLLMPKKYESNVTFLVEQPPARPEASAFAVLERMGHLASRETEVQLLQSRRVLEPVVEAFALHVAMEAPEGEVRPEDLFSGFRADANARPGAYRLEQAANGVYAVTNLASEQTRTSEGPGTTLAFGGVSIDVTDSDRIPGPLEITVVPFSAAVETTQKRVEAKLLEREADLVSLTCSGNTPSSAQSLCSAMSESYLDLRSELQRAEATAAANFLAEQTEIVRGRLITAEDELGTYVERTQAVALQTRASEQVRLNAGIWANREQLRAERAALSVLVEDVNRGDAPTKRWRDLASYPTFLAQDDGIVPKLVSTLVDLETRRNELAITRTDRDVEFVALTSRINEVEGQLHSITTGYARALGAQIGSLDQALANSGAELARIPRKQIETARLERQVSLLEELFGFLQTRLQEAQIAQAVELPSVRVVDRPSLPYKAAEPNRRVNVALGFLLASAFGMMAGLWKEYSDTRVREPLTLEEETGIPVLGMIPRLTTPGPIVPVSLPAMNGHLGVALTTTWNDDLELALEAFRTLSTDLNFAGQQAIGSDDRLVAITGSVRGEGKTLTACNLALARAIQGDRTLLIDGDLRGRGVSRFFRLPRGLPGLTEVLDDQTDLEATLRKLEVGDGRQLHLMPAGAGTPNSTEMLHSRRIERLLHKLRDQFDLVVVDTPPLNLITDAAVIAAAVDGVVVVVRRDVTDRAALTRTLERLRRSGASVSGIVVNDVELPAFYETYPYEA